jgi:signal transduction histidine kinase
MTAQMTTTNETDRHLNILVIEDNPHDARLVEIYLQELDMIDHGLIVCQTMGEALQLLSQHPGFDAIISDLTLPDSSGMETVETLVQARPDQAIIIQTGHNDKEIGLKAVKAGAQDFLVKGAYQPEDLAKTVRYAIERRSILDRLEDIQRKANIGHFELNVAKGLITASAQFCRMLALGETGNSFALKSIFHKHPALSNAFELLEDTNSTTGVERDVHLEFAEGAKKWFALHVKPSKDGTRITGLLQDITSRRETEEMRRQNEVAHQAAMMKEQFIASVSHEMRTPMNAILGMSNLLLDYSLAEEQRNYIKSIKQSSELLLGIVNDILTISSLQNSAVHFDEKPFNLHELFANILNIISYKVHEKGLSFDLQIEEDVPVQLLGDKLRLNQILLNLVGNAVKFTDEGQISVYVYKISSFGNEVKLGFEVSDTGIGIPQDKIDAIFESFTRVAYKDRLFEGTGLGLSITKKLIEQQGGTIKAISEVGKGSKFSFGLNFILAGEEVFSDQNDHKLIHFDPQTHFKILLAEDNKLNQIVAIKTIERQFPNATIDLAIHGEEAVKKLSENTYHIVLMDLQMPVMDGTEAVKHMRDHGPDGHRDLFILAMTAHAHIGEQGQVETILMDDFVLKPFEPEQLYAKISKYVQLRLDGNKSSYGRK